MRVSVVYDFFASVYVKHIWTFEGYCRRFSVGPRKEESRAVEGDALREREEPALRRSSSQFPVFPSSDSGIAGMHLCGLAEATKPGKQVHLYDPSVLVHFPFWHRGTLSLMSSHSFMSAGKWRNQRRQGWITFITSFPGPILSLPLPRLPSCFKLYLTIIWRQTKFSPSLIREPF